MFDETTDSSHREQMTFIVRYLWKENVREDFITFIDAYKCAEYLSGGEAKENKLTGKTLGDNSFTPFEITWIKLKFLCGYRYRWCISYEFRTSWKCCTHTARGS